MSPLSPLTLKEANISGLSSIAEAISGGIKAERSRFPSFVYLRTPLVFVFLFLSTRTGFLISPRRDQTCKIEFRVSLFPRRLRGSLETGQPILVLLMFGLDGLCLHQKALGEG